MNNSPTIPVGSDVLGRFLDSHGEPLDERRPLAHATRVPLLPPIEARDQQQERRMLETGIKPVDLLAPLMVGGVTSVFGNVGVGKLVLIEELMYTIITHYNGYIVSLGMDEAGYEHSELMEIFRELEMQDKVVLLYERMTSEPEVFERMVRAAFTIAAHFQQQGHDVLLIADKHTVTQGKLVAMPELKQFAQRLGVTTVLLRKGSETVHQEEQVTLDRLDGRIVLSHDLAQQGMYPAMDRQVSDSHLLREGTVSEEHMQVAQRVRQVVRRAQELQRSAQKEPLSSEEQQLVHRAARIQQFLTHPLFVAERFTDRPGAFVPIAQTIQDFKAILDGQYDDVPVEVFAYVGSIGV